MPVTLGAVTTPARALVAPGAGGIMTLRDTGSTYLDGAEQRVLEILRGCRDVGSLSDEPLSHATSWPERYHLSSVRSNVLRPLEIPSTARVLEIGAGCGAVTRYLGESAALVDALEPVPLRASCIAERTRDLDTVQVLVGEIDDIPPVPAYDIVVVIGVLEYVGSGSPDRAPYREFLSAIAERLVDGGSLVLAIENKLGAKYFAGAPEDHSGRPFDSVEDYPVGAPARTFDRRALTDLVAEVGLLADSAVAFPDYKMTRAVFRPDLVTPDTESLLFRVPTFPSPDWVIPRAAVADEARLWQSFVRAGLAADTGNSFLIVAGKSAASELWPRDTVGVYYSAGRRGEFVTESRIDVTGPPVIRRRRLSTATLDGPLRLVPAEQPVVAGVDLLDLVVDTDDPVTRRYLAEWVDMLDTATDPTTGRPPLDLVPHNLVVGADGRLRFIDDEWRADFATREVVLRRGALYIGIKLAESPHPKGTWAGCRTFEDALRAVGTVVGLGEDPDWVDRAIRDEAELQVLVTTWHGGDSAVVVQALQTILARDIHPVPAPALTPEMVAALEAELAEFRSLDLTRERLNRLAMADELIGLRAELAQNRVHAEAAIAAAGVEADRLRQILDVTLVDLAQAREQAAQARREADAVSADGAAIKASMTWRVGTKALAPARAARRWVRR